MCLQINFASTFAFYLGGIGIAIAAIGLTKGGSPVESAAVMIAASIVIAGRLIAAAITNIVEKTPPNQPN